MIEKAGWIAFSTGLLVGSLLMLWAATVNQPNCYEDEVIVWSGETNDHDICVPVDKMVPDSTVYFGD